MRDLRLRGRNVRLRSSGIQPEEQHRRDLEELIQRPRGVRGDRHGDRQSPRRLQGVRTPRQIRRQDHVLYQMRLALPRRPPGEGVLREPRRHDRKGARPGVHRPRYRLPRMRREAGTRGGFQPDVQDQHRTRVVPRRIPQTRDRPGDLRQLPEPLQIQQGEAPARGHADRKELQERDRPQAGYDQDEGVQPDGGGTLRRP